MGLNPNNYPRAEDGGIVIYIIPASPKAAISELRPAPSEDKINRRAF